MLEWVNPGCPYVRKHYDSANMPATQKDATAKGVVWLAVNSTNTGAYDYMPPAKLDGWMKDKGGAPTATLMDTDGKVGRAYGARTTPHMYVIDPNGKLVYAGAIDSKATSNPADTRTEGATTARVRSAATACTGPRIRARNSRESGLPTNARKFPRVPAACSTPGGALCVPRSSR